MTGAMAKPKNPIPLDQLSAETRQLCEVANEEDDFPCVLICASFLDECLKTMLEKALGASSSVLTEMLHTDRPLGTFSSRRDLLHCLGLVNERDYRNLRLIAKIRNDFAHSHLRMGFDAESVSSRCKELEFPGGDGSDSPFQRFQDPRSRFIINCVLLANMLIARVLGLAKKSGPVWQ